MRQPSSEGRPLWKEWRPPPYRAKGRLGPACRQKNSLKRLSFVLGRRKQCLPGTREATKVPGQQDINSLGKDFHSHVFKS